MGPVVLSHLAEAVQGGGVRTSEETLGKPVDTLKGLFISAGVETILDGSHSRSNGWIGMCAELLVKK